MSTYIKKVTTKWNEVIENIEHPAHRKILKGFSSDLYHDIVSYFEDKNKIPNFEDIMEYALSFIMMSLNVQIKISKEFELMEKEFNKDIGNLSEDLFSSINSHKALSYEIENIYSLDETLAEMKEYSLTHEDLDTYMVIKSNFNEQQLALMELTKNRYTLGILSEDYLGVYDSYINDKHFSEFDGEQYK